MYDYIQGILVEITPAHAVLEQHGIGYHISISLQTYSKVHEKKECRLYIHQAIREDAHVLFGFADKSEREVFRQLISVSGIGPNTARLLLSSLSPPEIRNAIQQEDVSLLTSIKGIGIKTAQRIIVDLRDKILKTDVSSEIFSSGSNTIREESLSALIALGFPRNVVEKVLDKLLREQPGITVEELVKKSLNLI
jgi:Holliday junction DNA helicase RuvA